MTCCAIVDYGSGNLRSAEKGFRRMADEVPGTEIVLTGDPERVLAADMVVLPGVGAFAACRKGLSDRRGLEEAIRESVVDRGTPYMGICVGMQLMATVGREHGADCPGFGWIPGEVVELDRGHPPVKVPHMGWNALSDCHTSHPVLADVEPGDHVYFVHSYHLRPACDDMVLARANHGESFAAAVGRDNVVGMQFHPEKSQTTGLRIIGNFLAWRP